MTLAEDLVAFRRPADSRWAVRNALQGGYGLPADGPERRGRAAAAESAAVTARSRRLSLPRLRLAGPGSARSAPRPRSRAPALPRSRAPLGRSQAERSTPAARASRRSQNAIPAAQRR